MEAPGNVSMLAKWPPNPVNATRRFEGPFHLCLLGGTRALEHSVPKVEPEPAAHLNYFGVLMLIIPLRTHFHILRF
jgi:hypothetical protein